MNRLTKTLHLSSIPRARHSLIVSNGAPDLFLVIEKSLKRFFLNHVYLCDYMIFFTLQSLFIFLLQSIVLNTLFVILNLILQYYRAHSKKLINIMDF